MSRLRLGQCADVWQERDAVGASVFVQLLFVEYNALIYVTLVLEVYGRSLTAEYENARQ